MVGKLFPEANEALGSVEELKRNVAGRSLQFVSRVKAHYADYDERLTKVEGSLAKRLDEHAMDYESAISEELSNVGKQISDASSEDSSKVQEVAEQAALSFPADSAEQK